MSGVRYGDGANRQKRMQTSYEQEQLVSIFNYLRYSKYLVSVWYVDGLSALGHVSDDSRAPRHPDLLLPLHLPEGRTWTDVEQLRH